MSHTGDSLAARASASTPADRDLLHSPAVPAIEPEVDQQQLWRQLQSSYPILLRWMRCKLGDRELAADLLNDAVVMTMEHSRSGRLGECDNLPGYVFKIAMNLLRNHRRKRANQPHLHHRIEAAEQAGHESTPDTMEDTRLGQLTRRLLAGLSSTRDRAIVEQFYLQGIDKDSLCRKFAVSSLQFNVIISRARQRMKAMLEASGLTKIDLLCTVVWVLIVTAERHP